MPLFPLAHSDLKGNMFVQKPYTSYDILKVIVNNQIRYGQKHVTLSAVHLQY